MYRRDRLSAGIAVLLALMLLAAACGDSGGDDSAANTGETTEAPESAGGAEAEGGDGSGRLTPPGESHIGDEGEPVHGGHLVFGLEADTANPWAPYRVSGATSAYILLTAVTDPLFTATEEGEYAGVLVESVEPNEDFTQWTYRIREGIKFHDGTPLDGKAVEFNLETCQYAPLTAAALTSIKEITSSGQDVTITTNGPVVALPYLTLERQCGYMFSPQWLGSLPDVPQRKEGSPIYDAALAATPADGDTNSPVGLGAFVFESYTPGNGNSFVLHRNEDYWRGPNGITGEELPYLDTIEGVVAVDIDSRENGLRSGQFDIMHTSNADAISQFLEDDEFEVTATSLFGDTSYAMLNVAEGETDPEGVNADSPLLNVHCRRALAHAIDRERWRDERDAGLSLPANGPFGPGAMGYLEDSGYPDYDLDAASAEMETCLQELGRDSIEFSFNTTNDPFNVESNTLVVSMWEEAFGDQVDVTITPTEQGQYIGLALTGNFEAFGWRNHGGIDPFTQNYWWKSSSSAPIGSLALNFGRFKDPEIDAAFETITSNPDPEARRAAAEEVNRIFGEQVYNFWLVHALWGIIQAPYVNGLESNALPDGGEGVGLAFSGRHQTNQIWCNEGRCE